jgi:wyosine [tRNA(Phe)-imidazoG37] synthetase (radical SAM superfamily)
MLHKTDVFQALCKIDENLMKLDAASDKLIRFIDQPAINEFKAEKLIEQLCRFDGKLTIQTIFLQGEHQGVSVDNTRDDDVERWIEALKKIRPRKVMIYTINRDTPVESLQKVPVETLEMIAGKVRKAGFQVTIAG